MHSQMPMPMVHTFKVISTICCYNFNAKNILLPTFCVFCPALSLSLSHHLQKLSYLISFVLCKAHFASKFLWLLSLSLRLCVCLFFIGLSSAMPRIPIIISFMVYSYGVYFVYNTFECVHN